MLSYIVSFRKSFTGYKNAGCSSQLGQAFREYESMSEAKREKLFIQIKQNPKNVRFDDLKKLYEMFGFEVKKPRRGSHYVCELDEYTISLPKPHKNKKHVGIRYVKMAISTFEEIKDKEEL